MRIFFFSCSITRREGTNDDMGVDRTKVARSRLTKRRSRSNSQRSAHLPHLPHLLLGNFPPLVLLFAMLTKELMSLKKADQ